MICNHDCELYKPPSMVRAVVHPDVDLPALLVLTTLSWYVENACRPVILALVLVGRTMLLLARFESEEAL